VDNRKQNLQMASISFHNNGSSFTVSKTIPLNYGDNGFPSKIAGYENRAHHRYGAQNAANCIDNSKVNLTVTNNSGMSADIQNGIGPNSRMTLASGSSASFVVLKELVVNVDGKRAFLRNSHGTVSVQNDSTRGMIMSDGGYQFEIMPPVNEGLSIVNPTPTTQIVRASVPSTSAPTGTPIIYTALPGQPIQHSPVAPATPVTTSAPAPPVAARTPAGLQRIYPAAPTGGIRRTVPPPTAPPTTTDGGVRVAVPPATTAPTTTVPVTPAAPVTAPATSQNHIIMRPTMTAGRVPSSDHPIHNSPFRPPGIIPVGWDGKTPLEPFPANQRYRTEIPVTEPIVKVPARDPNAAPPLLQQLPPGDYHVTFAYPGAPVGHIRNGDGNIVAQRNVVTGLMEYMSQEYNV